MSMSERSERGNNLLTNSVLLKSRQSNQRRPISPPVSRQLIQRRPVSPLVSPQFNQERSISRPVSPQFNRRRSISPPVSRQLIQQRSISPPVSRQLIQRRPVSPLVSPQFNRRRSISPPVSPQFNPRRSISPPESRQQSTSKRNCTECRKKPQQVQCLHCSQQVCVECAQKHVNSAMDETETVVHLLNEKLDVLDRISTNTRQKIVAERDKIVQMADSERDRSFKLLAEMIEKEKQKLRNKNKQLSESPLNEIPRFIQRIKSDVQHLTEKNETLFNVSSKLPKITLNNTSDSRRKCYESDEEYG